MITQSANIDKVYNYIVCKSTAILFEACWKYKNSGNSKICLSFLKNIKDWGHTFIFRNHFHVFITIFQSVEI